MDIRGIRWWNGLWQFPGNQIVNGGDVLGFRFSRAGNQIVGEVNNIWFHPDQARLKNRFQQRCVENSPGSDGTDVAEDTSRRWVQKFDVRKFSQLSRKVLSVPAHPRAFFNRKSILE